MLDARRALADLGPQPRRRHQDERRKAVRLDFHLRATAAFLGGKHRQVALRAQEATFLVGYVRGHQKMPELMADGEPATLRRNSVPDEDNAAASFAVGQQTAFEALRRERLDLDDIEPSAELLDRDRH